MPKPKPQRSDSPRRKAVSVELTPAGHRIVQQFKAKSGISQKNVLARLIELFGSWGYDRQIDLAAGRMAPKDGESDAPR